MKTADELMTAFMALGMCLMVFAVVGAYGGPYAIARSVFGLLTSLSVSVPVFIV